MAEKDNSNGKGKPLDLGGDAAKGRTTGQFPAQTPSAPGRTGSNPAHVPQSKTGSHPAAQPLKTRTASIPAQPMPLGPGASGPREPTPFQKAQLSSAFQGAREAESKAKRAMTLGKTTKAFGDDDDEPTSMGQHFDGENAPKELTNRDVWKAVQPPVQSREGRRSADAYQNVIDQFAVGKNPRYEPDAPDKPRSHIFVWDVSRAMNCEIPHFVGAKELSLAQTVDWLRHEGPMRGWTRATEEDAQKAALGGQLAVVLPRDIKLKLMAIVLPEEALLVAAAAKGRGRKLTVPEALGVHAVEYFVHV